MRISDWSSDVCSSDLRRPFSASGGGVLSLFQTDNLPHPVLVAKRELRLHGLGLSLAGMPDGHREAAVYLVVTVIILFGRRGLEEIGRASCRDRVCQYV